MAEHNTELIVEGELEMIEVLRCMCGDPDGIHPGEPCPKAQVVKLGSAAEWESNHLLRAAFNTEQRLRQLRRKFKRG